MMKIKLKYIIPFVILITTYFFGCADLFINPNSSSSGNNLSISIFSPSTNDSISYSGIQVNYTLSEQLGINFIELYVNGQIHKWIPPNSDGSKPTIILSLDSTFIGTKISFYLIYYDKDGKSVRSDSISNLYVSGIVNIPYTPYNFTFTYISSNSLNLSWKDSTVINSPGYEIWRKVGYFGSYSIHLTSPPNSFNVNDNSVSDTNIYYYKIRGINNSGVSGFSNEISTGGNGSFRAIPPPTNVVAKATSSDSVLITWKYSGAAINYFKVERKYSWSSYNTIAILNGNVNQFLDNNSGLVPSTEYYYRVKAFSSSDSSWSNDILVTTPAN
ncbi:MAG: fibronectin type III domain-containing protein [Ignavibacteriaceae bacterium]